MSKYPWPALLTVTETSHKLTFPDWPNISVQSENQQDAYNQAKAALIHNVIKQIELKSDIPGQSEFGFHNKWIEIDAATSARLNSYLKEQKWEHIRETNDLWESFQLRHAAYLTDYRASIEPIERICENADRGANEFASIGVRFCYILNAGGLVVIPAIMELLPELQLRDHQCLVRRFCSHVAYY